MKTRIALATAAQYPQLAPEDQILHAALQQHGVSAEPVVWDGDADWSQYDVVVVRSIWDYHLKYPQFLAWLSALDAAHVPVHNQTDVLRWNGDKRYLVELEQRGVRITPTRVVLSDDDVSLADVLGETGWRHAVIKPTVASTGYETWFFDAPASPADEARFADQKQRMNMLVQEFAAGVKGGEFSFVFIDGEYTHSVLKRAAGEEFRVHIEHGGTVEPASPTAAQIDWARSVVDTLDSRPWTYARVDAVAMGTGMMLMEFELLDPELFFSYSPAATERMVQAIVR